MKPGSRHQKRERLNKPFIIEAKTSDVVMHATETCYGLAADIFNEDALKKVYKIKKMDAGKPVSIMVRDLEEAKKYAVFNNLAEKIAKQFWPGPLTLVLPRKKALPDFLNPGHDFVGLRCPASEAAQSLMSAFNGPLTTTSANISGKPEVYTVDDFLSQLEKGDEAPGLIMDAGKIAKRKPSTIIKIVDSELQILREGDLSEEITAFVL